MENSSAAKSIQISHFMKCEIIHPDGTWEET